MSDWKKNVYERKKKTLTEKTKKWRTNSSKPPDRKNRKRTRCEIAMMNILNDLRIEFESEYPVYFCHQWKVYDMRIGNSILIEVDGDYWHGNPEMSKLSQFHLIKNKKNDLMKNFIAKKNGFNLLRFWESDVHNNKDLVVKRLLEAVKEAKEVI